jgi:hypothetical protein
MKITVDPLYLFIALIIMRMADQSNLIIILLQIIVIISSTNIEFTNKPEQFIRIEKRRERLNAERGKWDRFLVDCDSCDRRGRKWAIDDELTFKPITNKQLPKIQIPEAQQYNTISMLDENYRDKDQAFCYNCLLDNDTRQLVRNYLDDYDVATNGPPDNFFDKRI